MYTEKQKGIGALVLAALSFALVGFFIRQLATNFLLFQQVYLRIGVAFILGLILFHKDLNWSKIRKISTKEWMLIIGRSFIRYVGGVVLFTQAVLETKYSNVAFIGALPLSAVFGIVLFKEKLTFQKVLFLAIAFCGVLLIAVKDYSQILVWGRGEFITLLSTTCFSLGYVSRKWHTNLLNNKEITQLMFFFATLMVFTISLGTGEGMPNTNWNGELLFAVVAAGLLNIGILLFSNYGFQKVPAVIASNVLAFDPVFALLVGFVFFHEVPNFLELTGGAIIISSVWGMNRLKD